MPAFLMSSGESEYFAINSDNSFGTLDPDKETVVPNWEAEVIGMTPAQIGIVIW